ncbi:MAG: membrane protein insertion efficiency factor YidD [Proteobacteria bacterium]|nr:membrane protein insertion efficiency factor YidD [Pseudomonadota bacterium]
MKTLVIFVIKTYQVGVSPFIGNNCRFSPTCSQYTVETINKKGVVKGCWLGVCRLFKCHPWHPGGYDPSP